LWVNGDRCSPAQIRDLNQNRPHHLSTKRTLYSKYSIMEYFEFMKWQIEEHKQYTEWFEGQEEELQDEILAVVDLSSAKRRSKALSSLCGYP
jgi:hypothetical protein